MARLFAPPTQLKTIFTAILISVFQLCVWTALYPKENLLPFSIILASVFSLQLFSCCSVSLNTRITRIRCVVLFTVMYDNIRLHGSNKMHTCMCVCVCVCLSDN